MMPDAQLAQIERRADLYLNWLGLPLSPDDVRDLLAEVHELRADRAQLAARLHRSLAELGQLGTEAAELR